MYKALRKYLILFIACTTPMLLQAQQNSLQKATSLKQKANAEFKHKIKSKTSVFFNTTIKNPTRYIGLEVQANSNGYSLGLFYTKKQSTRIQRYWSINMNEIKHPKEEKRKTSMYQIQGEGKPRPYSFGKLNDVYCFNVSYGHSRTLLPSLISQSMDLSLVIHTGLSLACIKPYYLRVNTSTIPSQYKLEDIAYLPSSNPNYLNSNRIYGKASWSEGLEETKFFPGLHLSTALHIQLQPNQIWFKSVAIGATLQAFTAKLPLLIDTKAHLIHPSLFMRVQVGKGW